MSKNFTTVADLSPPSEPEVQPTLRELVYNQFLGLVDQPKFPCLGARAAMVRQTYMFNLYQDLRSEQSLSRLLQDVEYFTRARAEMGSYCTFAASFVEPAFPGTDEEWHEQVWKFFHRLRTMDAASCQPWDDRFARDPLDGEFALSLFGCGYLFVALYPGAWRYARRFAWPTIIFNPAEQDHQNFPLHEHFLNFRDSIRTRDSKIQVHSNPSLPPTPEYTQATGFAGVITDPEAWKCPIDLELPEEIAEDAYGRPYPTYELAKEEAGALADRARLACKYMELPPDGDELVSVASTLIPRLPPMLLRRLHQFRCGELDSDVFLIRHFQADAAASPTPASSSEPIADHAELATAAGLLGICLLLGEPFNFASFYHGHIVQPVVPVPGKETTQTSESSAGELSWHVEDGFRADRCDYLALLCIREEGGAVTMVAQARDLELSDDDLRVLREKRFLMEPDTAHVTSAVQPDSVAVLTGNDGDLQICFDAYYLTPARDDDREAADALGRLRKELDRVQVGVALEAGDLMIVDNRRAVHARAPFESSYGTSGRWLMRAMVCSSLRQHRAAGGRVYSRTVHTGNVGV